MPRGVPKNPNSKAYLKAREYKLHCHRHNALVGSAKLAETCIRQIIDAPSAAEEAVNDAKMALRALQRARLILATHRVEPDGSVRKYR